MGMSAVIFVGCIRFKLSVTASYSDHRREGSFGTPLLWQWHHACLLSQGQSRLFGDVDLQGRCEITISSWLRPWTTQRFSHQPHLPELWGPGCARGESQLGGNINFPLSQMPSKGNSFHWGWTSFLSKASFKENFSCCVILSCLFVWFFFSLVGREVFVLFCFVLFFSVEHDGAPFLLIGYFRELKLNSLPQKKKKNPISYPPEKRFFPPSSGQENTEMMMILNKTFTSSYIFLLSLAQWEK